MITKPATDLLETQFGRVYADVFFQNNKRRVVSTRTLEGDQPLALSIVYFNTAVAKKYSAVHSRIQEGELIGKAFREAEVGLERKMLGSILIEIPSLARRLFTHLGAGKIIAKKVSFLVAPQKEEYAQIFEFYSPNVAFPDKRQYSDKVLTKEIRALFADTKLFVILQLHESNLDDFLRLAHGFLKKPQHVGIKNTNDFVVASRTTGKELLHDSNTRIFVAQSKNEMIGYISINFHPALHVNGVECIIREVFVKEEYRLQGVGRSLVQYVDRFARRKNMKRISLATNWDHSDQHSFYQKLGFTRRCDFVVKYLTSQEIKNLPPKKNLKSSKRRTRAAAAGAKGR